MTPQEQLNADAEKFASQFIDGRDSFYGFRQGALSPTAANGCNKHVEIAKIEFAIKWTESLGAANVDLKETQLYKASIWQLNQQLETLKKQQ
jgi:hypothetical protein